MDRVKTFLDRPYSDEMNAADWVLFLGFVAIVALGWNVVLSHILATAE